MSVNGSFLLHKDSKKFSILYYISSDPKDTRDEHSYILFIEKGIKKCCAMILEEINKRNININIIIFFKILYKKRKGYENGDYGNHDIYIYI